MFLNSKKCSEHQKDEDEDVVMAIDPTPQALVAVNITDRCPPA
jgi:hypothetical protein